LTAPELDAGRQIAIVNEVGLATTTAYDLDGRVASVMASRIVTSISGNSVTTYTFDNAGNTWLENTLGQVVTNSYDGENRLVKVLNADGTISTYAYSRDGPRRTAQEPGDPISTMIWDGGDYLGEAK
jgi:YD repeat-containing protein